MPLPIQRWNVVLHDRAIAPAALWRKHVKVIVPTIRFAVPLVESLLAKLLPALGAEEVLRVPRFFQRSHAFLKERKNPSHVKIWKTKVPNLSSFLYIQDGSVAVRASGTEQVVIIGLAVRVSVPLEEVPRTQLLVAVIASKVLRMPSFSKSRNHLADDRFLARVTAALLRCGYPLATHVRLQIAKHRVQVVVALWQGARSRLGDGGVLNMGDSLVGLRVIRDRL